MDKSTLGRSRTAWRAVINVIHDELPKNFAYHSSLTNSPAMGTEISAQKDLELNELAAPKPAHIRHAPTFQTQHDTYYRGRKSKDM
jgi:hypothetical protein